MHECPDCGQACDCDGEDTWMDLWAIGQTEHDCINEDCGREDFDESAAETAQPERKTGPLSNP